MDWFERMTGFVERDRAQVLSLLSVADGRLHSSCNGRSWSVGALELVSLAQLRVRAAAALTGQGRTRVSAVAADVRQLHREPAHARAVFQVASQFNLLEMIGPHIDPDHGVTRYQADPTQGPACAIAAGAATIYRNYFVPMGGQVGQQGDRQINGLADLGEALGHDREPLWVYRNGYVLCTRDGLQRISRQLAAADATEHDRLRGLLRVGVHWDVEVTDGAAWPGPTVTQVFCSALPVAYSDQPRSAWESFATLVLEAAYEATLLAGVVNRARDTGSDQVLLTRLGGGAFGNEARWIDRAIERAGRVVADAGLDVRHVVR